ncbi:MAG: ribbon-helix-helix domain-containing protein [Xenococcaceae cyanobacterium]
MPRGNFDFGTKYRAPRKSTKLLTEQVKARIDEETKERLRKLADRQQCTVPDLLRIAIDELLDNSTLLDDSVLSQCD